MRILLPPLPAHLHERPDLVSEGRRRPGRLRGVLDAPDAELRGAGFTFDIFPTDPNHPANAGWSDDDDDDDPEDFDPDDFDSAISDGSENENYDPDETRWKRLDEEFGAENPDADDIEGEEWKFGLQPGERLPERAGWSDEARKEWEEEQKRYDSPDERPREVDWSDRKDRERPEGTGSTIEEDDIPF